MKLTYKDLFDVQTMLEKVWEFPLMPKIFMRLRRLARTINEEIKTFDPERIKLFQRFPQFIKDGKFYPPKESDDGYAEFLKDYNETFSVEVDIPYENMDVGEIEADIEKGKEKINGKDANALLDMIEILNGANDKQKEKPVSAPAE